ncbi:MAG: hypothetical protein U0794_10025 [Isosphaeraceae bacterium]
MPYIHTMLKNRFIPAIGIAISIPLAAWAQAPSAPTAAPGAVAGAGASPTAKPAAPNLPPTEAELLLDAAAKKVAALKSVAADVAQKVDMLDQKFQVKGRYLKAPNNRVYLRLDVAGLPDATGTMLQVCDGQTLWDYQQVLDSQMYRKVEVGQVFDKLKSPELDEELKVSIVNQLGFAGPDELIKGLRKQVRFEQKEAGTLDGKDVWIIRGEWKNRDGLLGPNQTLPPTVSLPAFVPSLIVISIGKDDGWPYKVVFVGKRPSVLMDTRKIGPDGRPIGGRSTIADVRPTRIELTYSNVKLNPDLKLEEFVFQAPPGAQVQDATTGLVGMLDQAIQLKAAQKKLEAAKAEGPTLPQSIEIPKTGDLPGIPDRSGSGALPK